MATIATAPIYPRLPYRRGFAQDLLERTDIPFSCGEAWADGNTIHVETNNEYTDFTVSVRVSPEDTPLILSDKLRDEFDRQNVEIKQEWEDSYVDWNQEQGYGSNGWTSL